MPNQFLDVRLNTIAISGLDTIFAVVARKEEPIPSRDALDRILPYETAIERGLNRAVDRLERLQRRRKENQFSRP